MANLHETNKDIIQANDYLHLSFILSVSLSQEHQRENKRDSICFAIDLAQIGHSDEDSANLSYKEEKESVGWNQNMKSDTWNQKIN